MRLEVISREVVRVPEVEVTPSMIQAGINALFELKTDEWEIGSNIENVLEAIYMRMHASRST